jgi:tetratricopeptide (TPR) repeat protein
MPTAGATTLPKTFKKIRISYERPHGLTTHAQRQRSFAHAPFSLCGDARAKSKFALPQVRRRLPSRPMNLSDDDRRHTTAALGWLELGLFAESFAELDNVAPENRANPNVLVVRWTVYHAANEWMEAAEVARRLTTVAPDFFDGWWMLSFALHEMKRTQEAHDNLASVIERFKGEFLAHYNLACYLVQLGRVEEARGSLKCALTLNPAQREVALSDPDLEPLWTEVRTAKFSGQGE